MKLWWGGAPSSLLVLLPSIITNCITSTLHHYLCYFLPSSQLGFLPPFITTCITSFIYHYLYYFLHLSLHIWLPPFITTCITSSLKKNKFSIIHKPSLGSLDVPQKFWADIGSAVFTFIGYKQTIIQSDKPNLYIDIEIECVLYCTVNYLPNYPPPPLPTLSCRNLKMKLLMWSSLISLLRFWFEISRNGLKLVKTTFKGIVLWVQKYLLVKFRGGGGWLKLNKRFGGLLIGFWKL